jgi:iron-sulfur cluster assembly accessory protein
LQCDIQHGDDFASVPVPARTPLQKDAAMTMVDAPTAPFAVTERAARRIGKVLASEPQGAMLRLAVNGGGCSGFQYDFSFDTARAPDDIAIERDGVTVLVDSVSLPFLEGATLDFVDDLMGQSFRVENPNATAACGCGTSFSI